jgi:hypothetical protein
MEVLGWIVFYIILLFALKILKLKFRHDKVSCGACIDKICQVRQEDEVAMVTYVVPRMAYGQHLASIRALDRLSIVCIQTLVTRPFRLFHQEL